MSISVSIDLNESDRQIVSGTALHLKSLKECKVPEYNRVRYPPIKRADQAPTEERKAA
jgi:hypothetical protein